MNANWVIGRYQLHLIKQSLIIVGSILTSVVIISLVLALFIPGDVVFMSLEISTVITVFMGGVNAFKECFSFALQNGMPRHNIYAGTLMAGAAAAAAYALMEQLLFALAMGAEVLAPNLHWESLLTLVYAARYEGQGTLTLHLENYLLNFAINLTMFMSGYFISLAYYRMSKRMKTLVTVGVPAVFVVLLPVIDMLTGGWLMKNLLSGLIQVLGLSTVNPWCAVASFVVLAAAFGALSWPLIRRATVKA